jgi:MraZ protein
MANDTRASYTDTFGHAFDAKGRITVPSEWREESYEKRLFVVPTAEKCVRVYPESWLGRLQEQVSLLKDADPMRKKMKDVASLAQGTTWDQQGRMMVKEKLRLGAGLKKESVMVGRLDHFEIWDKAAWDAQETTPTTIEEALSAMGL